jgi:hypothetical protein
VEAGEVEEVASDMEGRDLALALQGDPVRGGEALQERAAARGLLALAHDVLIGRQGRDLDRQAQERRPLVGREVERALQLGDDRTGVEERRRDHDVLSCRQAAARSLGRQRL